MEFENYLRFVLALVFVLGLIGAAGLLVRRLMPGMRHVNRGPHRRISVVEVVVLDTKRKLVLVKRDDVEHLVILGPTSEIVVESGIRKSFAEEVTDARDSGGLPPAGTRNVQAPAEASS